MLLKTWLGLGKWTTSLLAVLVALPAAAQTNLRILRVEPTALFPKAQPLRQIALVHVDNPAGTGVAATVSLSIAGQQISEDCTFAPGETVQQILIPDITAPTELKVMIQSRDAAHPDSLADWRGSWAPQRKWRVYIVKSSHEDLGYEGTIYEKTHDNANWIDIGKRLSDPPDTYGQ